MRVPRELILVAFALACINVSTSEKNRFVSVPHTSSCGRQFSEDGLLIMSSSVPSERCTLTLTPGYNRKKKLLLRFERVSLPAQGYIQPSIAVRYQGVSEPVVVVRQNSSGVVGKLYPLVSAVDLDFQNILSTSDFRIVVARTEDDFLCSGEHICSTTRYCIDKDLRCDLIDHCGDNSDETVYCIMVDHQQQMPIGVVISGAVVAFIVVLSIGATIGICRRRRLHGLMSRRAPTLVTQSAPGGAQASGIGFMPVPQSDPYAPAPYPQQAQYWQSPMTVPATATGAPSFPPPSYDAAVSAGIYPTPYPPAGTSAIGPQPPYPIAPPVLAPPCATSNSGA